MSLVVNYSNTARIRCRICSYLSTRRTMSYPQLPKLSTDSSPASTTASPTSNSRSAKRPDTAALHIGHTRRIVWVKALEVRGETLLRAIMHQQRHNTLSRKRPREATRESRRCWQRREIRTMRNWISTVITMRDIRIRARRLTETARFERRPMRRRLGWG